MRINYSDDEDFPGQCELWQANCQRSIKGKAGQSALRELEQALLAMPEKRLIDGALINQEGDVCAIGALMKHRGIQETKADPEEMEEVGVELGVPRMVVWKIVSLNDIEFSDYLDGREWKQTTPEQRYEKMLAWVRRQLAPESQTVGV